MICLSYADCKEWLARVGVGVDENRNLLFPRLQASIMTTMPKSALAMSHFSCSLCEWLGASRERLLWLSNWNTDLGHQLQLFEAVRYAAGEARPVIDAPGHLFRCDAGRENAAVASLMFLIMAFNWEGYLVSENGSDFVFLGDEHIVFGSGDVARMNQIAQLIGPFKLEIIEDAKQAWR
jgi:hypothetical protein